MAGRTIAEAASERETLTRDPLMWHGTIVTQDRLCSEMLATFRMSRAKSGLSTNGPFAAYKLRHLTCTDDPSTPRSAMVPRQPTGVR